MKRILLVLAVLLCVASVAEAHGRRSFRGPRQPPRRQSQQANRQHHNGNAPNIDIQLPFFRFSL